MTFGPTAARLTERDPRTHWQRGGILLTNAVAVAVVVTLSPADAPGRRLMAAIVWVNAVGLGLLAVAGGVGAVAAERRAGRLAVLLLAEPRPKCFAVNLITPSVWSAWTLLAAQVPAAMLTVTAGGVAVWQVAAAFACLAAWVALAAAVGVWEGAYSREGGVAVFKAVAMLALASLFSAMPRELSGVAGVEVFPVDTLSAVIDGGRPWAGGYPVVAAIASWWVLGLAGRTLLNAAQWPGDVSLPATPDAEDRQRRIRRSFPIGDRDPHRWRGWHFGVGGWDGILGRAGVFAVVTFAVTVASPFGWLIAVVVGLSVLAIGEAAVSTARRIAEEVAEDRGELLLLLPTPPSDAAKGLQWASDRVMNVLASAGIAAMVGIVYAFMNGTIPSQSAPTMGLVFSIVMAVEVSKHVAGGLAVRSDAAKAAGAGLAAGLATFAFGWGMLASMTRTSAASRLDGLFAKLVAGLAVPLAACLASRLLVPRADGPMEEFIRQLIIGPAWRADAPPIRGRSLEEATEALRLRSARDQPPAADRLR